MQVAQPTPAPWQPPTWPGERQQIQHHHRPACPAAPHTPEYQWAEDLGDQVVDHCHLDHTGHQAKEDALNLHIFYADEQGEDHQERADHHQRQPPTERLSLFRQHGVQPEAYTQRKTDVTKQKQGLQVA